MGQNKLVQHEVYIMETLPTELILKHDTQIEVIKNVVRK